MEEIKIITTVDKPITDLLPQLSPMAGKKVEILVREQDGQLPARRPGWLKGKLWMSDDFDAPLEDFKDYM